MTHSPRTRLTTLLALVLVAIAAPALASTGTDVPGVGSAPVYRSPLPGHADVLRAFDAPPQPWLAGHRGVDLAAVPGGDVLAPGAGVVTFAGRVVDRSVVTIVHPDGRRSSIEPVAPDVHEGDTVSAGDVIGTVDPDGKHCARPCVHSGVRAATGSPPRYLDPLALIGLAAPIVLLPDP